MERDTSLDLSESTNTIVPNEATSGFVPISITTYAAASYRIIIYGISELRLIAMVASASGNNYFLIWSQGNFWTNGMTIYNVSIIPRNPFSYWIPAGILTNTLTILPVASLYSMINHTNHGSGHISLHHMAQNAMPQIDVENMGFEGLLALQDQVGFVNTGLSREVIVARMKCIKYESTEKSTSDNDTCCICLDVFSDGQNIGSTDCQHVFHFDCISDWLMQKNTCPLCKRIALAM